MLGSWSLAGTDGVSLFEGLREVWPGAELHTAMDGELGSLFDGVTDVEDRIDEACAELAECDVILAAVGENQNDTGECSSKTDLRLTRNQRRMVERLCALGKPVVLVVFSGRPLEIREEAEQCAAVVQAWFLGTESGTALADVLTGRVNPSGRLSMSFPQTVGQIPVYYNHANTGRPRLTGEQSERFTTRFIDCPNEPLYPFGYGLSYTKFSYRDLRAEQNGDTWSVRVRVRSEEGPEGVETVQLYIRDCSASRVRPYRSCAAYSVSVCFRAKSGRFAFLLQRRPFLLERQQLCRGTGRVPYYGRQQFLSRALPKHHFGRLRLHAAARPAVKRR